MVNRIGNQANIDAMLATLRALQSEAGSGVQAPVAPGVQDLQGTQGTGRAGFADLVKGAVGKVNELQAESSRLQASFERGDDVPLTDVVLGMQKASLALEATLHVRNKVLKAYEDILNMPV